MCKSCNGGFFNVMVNFLAYLYVNFMMFFSVDLFICYDRYYELFVGFLCILIQKGEFLVCILLGFLYLYWMYIVIGYIGLFIYNLYFQFKFRFEINNDE